MKEKIENFKEFLKTATEKSASQEFVRISQQLRNDCFLSLARNKNKKPEELKTMGFSSFGELCSFYIVETERDIKKFENVLLKHFPD